MKRCLIIDDSRVIRRVAAMIIQDLGFAVEEAENGKKALDACCVRMPDVALIDLDMPVMDGMTFLRALRQMPGGDKVVTIICTADSGPPQIQQALDGGADEYVMKPFDSEIMHSKFLLLELL
ncbi:MAG: response regulator [Rhodospirillaceae bacterium]|nr:MAG: response regulator [Rhodospirillaceae bacterium]